MQCQLKPLEHHRVSVTHALRHHKSLPYVSQYWLITAIDCHLSRYFSDLVQGKGFIDKSMIRTRVDLAPDLALIVDSLSDGSNLFVQVESNSI